MKRRNFLKTAGAGAIGIGFLGNTLKADTPKSTSKQTHAVIVKGAEPAALVNAAINELGGMSAFINTGDIVVLKPNMGWDRRPELAANTNPQSVAELTRLCFSAGAKQVKVFDRTCNNPQRCYRNSQIEEAAREAGADVVHIRENRYRDLSLNGKLLESWPIYGEYLDADKVINIPVAKHHGLSRVTLGLKNLMGVMGGNRGSIHKQFPQKMADITKNILPTLTVIDAYRILTDNGPQGGNPDHVQTPKAMIASSCTVTADTLALELFDLKLKDIEYIRLAAEQGLAKFDISNLNVKRINLG